MKLNGKVALVTGASSGIGEGVARNLDDAGMKLVLTARRGGLLNRLCADLPTEAIAVPGDIADPALPQRLIDTAVDQLGACDVVFNNAGVMVVGSIDAIDLEAACRMVRVNVEAAYRMAYLGLRQMIAQGSGTLINVSSILGTKVRANAEAYCGTKYAIEALTEGLRQQVKGTGVRVTALEPGLIETHLQDHFDTHPREMLGIEKMVTPADVARVVRFVLEQPEHIMIPRLLVMPSEQGQ